jgi:cell division protein FtsQ
VAKRIGANRKRQIKGRRIPQSRRRAGVARWSGLVIAVGGIIAIAVTGVLAGVSRFDGWVSSSSFMKLKNIVIHGTEQVNDSTMLKSAGITAGMTLTNINPEVLRNAFLKNPWVEKVEVKKWFPGKLIVSVVERKPIVLVNLGSVYQMDRAGVLLPLPTGDFLDAPVVCGLADTVDQNRVRRITAKSLSRFTAFWDALERMNPAWQRQIAQIDLTKSAAIRITLAAHSTIIEIGTDDLNTKIDQVTKLLQVMKREGDRQPRLINLSYENMAFVQD